MRTLILSDPHGNHSALQAVLDHAYTTFRPTEVWCLGDTVGYGPEPFNVWHTLRGEPIPVGGWLAGNHDWGLVKKLRLVSLFNFNGAANNHVKIQNFREKAAEVLTWHREILGENDDLIQHLALLPVMSQPRPGIYLAHGAFLRDVNRSVTQYLVRAGIKAPLVSPKTMAANFTAAAETSETSVYSPPGSAAPRFFAFGHNHIPGLWRWQNNQWATLSLNEEHPLADLDQNPLCLNPGSAGFPRDGTGCPSYAIVDWSGDSRKGIPYVTIQHVSYDVNLTRNKMKADPYADLLEEPGLLEDPKC